MTRAYAGRALGPIVSPPRLITRIRRVIGGIVMTVGILPFVLEMYKAPERFDNMLDHTAWLVFLVGALIFGPRCIYNFARKFWFDLGPR